MSAWQVLIQRSGIPPWNLLKLIRLERRIREEFSAHAGMLHVFAGIPELIGKLQREGCRVGIISSNVPEVVSRTLQGANISADFVHAGSRVFGKARAISRTLKLYDVDKSHAVYVGDELRDVEACRQVGIDVVAVGWGFNDADVLRNTGIPVAATPQGLLSILTVTQ